MPQLAHAKAGADSPTIRTLWSWTNASKRPLIIVFAVVVVAAAAGVAIWQILKAIRKKRQSNDTPTQNPDSGGKKPDTSYTWPDEKDIADWVLLSFDDASSDGQNGPSTSAFSGRVDVAVVDRVVNNAQLLTNSPPMPLSPTAVSIPQTLLLRLKGSDATAKSRAITTALQPYGFSSASGVSNPLQFGSHWRTGNTDSRVLPIQQQGYVCSAWVLIDPTIHTGPRIMGNGNNPGPTQVTVFSTIPGDFSQTPASDLPQRTPSAKDRTMGARGWALSVCAKCVTLDLVYGATLMNNNAKKSWKSSGDIQWRWFTEKPSPSGPGIFVDPATNTPATQTVSLGAIFNDDKPHWIHVALHWVPTTGNAGFENQYGFTNFAEPGKLPFTDYSNMGAHLYINGEYVFPYNHNESLLTYDLGSIRSNISFWPLTDERASASGKLDLTHFHTGLSVGSNANPLQSGPSVAYADSYAGALSTWVAIVEPYDASLQANASTGAPDQYTIFWYETMPTSDGSGGSTSVCMSGRVYLRDVQALDNPVSCALDPMPASHRFNVPSDCFDAGLIDVAYWNNQLLFFTESNGSSSEEYKVWTLDLTTQDTATAAPVTAKFALADGKSWNGKLSAVFASTDSSLSKTLHFVLNQHDVYDVSQGSNILNPNPIWGSKIYNPVDQEWDAQDSFYSVQWAVAAPDSFLRSGGEERWYILGNTGTNLVAIIAPAANQPLKRLDVLQNVFPMNTQYKSMAGAAIARLVVASPATVERSPSSSTASGAIRLTDATRYALMTATKPSDVKPQS